VKVRYEARFEKDLNHLREPGILKRIKQVIEEVKQADTHYSLSNLKKLRGYDTFYRIRIGDYRIGIEITEEYVIFTRALHRKEIYRYFP
jgi:mRNA interferase RelE/StbE